MLNKTLALSAIVICFLIKSGYGFSDCGSTVGSLLNIKMENCGHSNERCILKRGTNISLVIDFTMKESTSQVRAVCYDIILDVPIPFALPNANACKDSGLTCPLEPNKTYTYTGTFFIPRKHPWARVDVQWELKDANEQDIVCVTTPAQIQ